MKRYWALLLALGMLVLGAAFAQQEDDDQVANLSFVILKDYNGQPIRNASVVLHPVKKDGKQERGAWS